MDKDAILQKMNAMSNLALTGVETLSELKRLQPETTEQANTVQSILNSIMQGLVEVANDISQS